MEVNRKLLVCITAQTNSKRLIDKGREIADDLRAEMHILHVVKGDSLFNTDESTALLQHLFDYGTELGGVIHGLCAENVLDTIINFVRAEKITNVLLGDPPANAPVPSEDICVRLHTIMPYLTIDVLTRD